MAAFAKYISSICTGKIDEKCLGESLLMGIQLDIKFILAADQGACTV